MDYPEVAECPLCKRENDEYEPDLESETPIIEKRESWGPDMTQMVHIRLKNRETPKGQIECPIGGTVSPKFCVKCAYATGCGNYEAYLAKKRNHVSKLRYAYWVFRAKLHEVFEYIDFKISELEDWTEHHSKAM